MASNGLQVGFEDAPAFPEDDPLASGADLEEVARFVVRRGNLFKGATAARNAFDDAVEGVFWSDTDDDTLYRSAGPGEWRPWESEWKTYTPSSVTITAGSGGTTVTRWRYASGRVLVQVRWTFASGGTITGTAKVALPVARAALAHAFEQAPEFGTFYQAAITRSHRIAIQADGSSTTVVSFGYGLPYLTGDVTATNPANPIAVGDTIHATFSYDPA